MKLWHCDWVPSSVAEWLVRELDERGISGTTYSYLLFSLLHPYFCLHPVPKERSYLQKLLLNLQDIKSVLNTDQLQELQLLFEEIEDKVHPDADFPELNTTDYTFRKGSDQTKRQPITYNYQGYSQSHEAKWKAIAHLFLKNSSPKQLDLDGVVDELFHRLKISNIGDKLDGERVTTTGDIQKGFGPLIDNSEGFSINSCRFNSSANEQNSNKQSFNWQEFILSIKAREDAQKHLQTLTAARDDSFQHGSISLISSEQNLLNQMDEKHLGNGISEEKASSFSPFGKSDWVQNPSGMFDNWPRANDNFVNYQSEEQKLEAWERAGTVVPNSARRSDSLDSMGSRLFERFSNASDAEKVHSDASKGVIKAPPHPVDHLWELPIGGYPANVNDWANSNDIDGSNKSADVSASLFPSEPLSLPGERENNNIKNDLYDKIASNFGNESGRFSDWATMNQNWSPLNIGMTEHGASSRKGSAGNVIGQSKFNLPTYEPDILKDRYPDFNENLLINAANEKLPFSNDNFMNKNENVFNEFKSEDKLCLSLRELGLEHLIKRPNGEDEHKNRFATDSGQSSSLSACDGSTNALLNFEQLLSLDQLPVPMDNPDRFQSDIPIGPNGPYVDLRHTESSGFSAVVPHEKHLSIVTDMNNPEEASMPISVTGLNNSDAFLDSTNTKEEENLLTSPRTHFRPIRQDSSEGKTDGQGISSQVADDPDLVFQRSGSGLLYLESDMINGSPKKYMTFNEPQGVQNKVRESKKEDVIISRYVDENGQPSFIPKFKLINNEKFCQTEESNETMVEKIKDTDWFSDLLKNKMKNHKNQMDKENTKNTWYKDHSDNLKLIWGQIPQKSKDEIKQMWEFENEQAYPKWSTNDQNEEWSNNPDEVLIIKKHIYNESDPTVYDIEDTNLTGKESETYQRIKFIWHNSVNSSSRPEQHQTTTEVDSLHSTSAPSEKHSQLSLQKLQKTRNYSESNKSLWSQDGKNGRSLRDEASRWRLQWEVNQEAEEILGGLYMKDSPQCLENDEIFQTSPDRLEESRKTDSDKIKFMEFLERQDNQPPIEDLDHLEPGWDLNEGFEWGPETEQVFQCDDEDVSQEVLVFEREDGETVMLPVEYLDDNLYDQIFGSEEIPIGGSLPAFPAGKKGNFKLSRRSRGSDRVSSHSKRPCSFFLEGKCLRKDCKFSHDLLTITCRFWEEGSCLKGENCPFRHGFMPTRRRNRSEGDHTALEDPMSFSLLKDGARYGSGGKPIPRRNRHSAASVSSFEIDSETDFPCLGSSVESKIGSLDETSSAFASHLKVTKIPKKKKNSIMTKNGSKESESETEKTVTAKTQGPTKKKKSKGHGREDHGEESGSHKKKVKGQKKSENIDIGSAKDCQSLKKILKKRFFMKSSTAPYYEDESLSDF